MAPLNSNVITSEASTALMAILTKFDAAERQLIQAIPTSRRN